MKTQSGNVLLYVLIAIVLFGALSFALMKSGGSDGGVGSRLSDDKAALKAGELIQYASAARSTVEQMRTLSNVLPTEFNFVRVGGAGYNTAPHTAKVYHPVGGGLNVFVPEPELFASTASMRGWLPQQGTNVSWSQTSASDILFTFVDLPRNICAAINEKLYREKSIPDLSQTSAEVFENGGGDDIDFTAADCPSCNGRNSACVKDSAGAYAFYNVVLSR